MKRLLLGLVAFASVGAVGFLLLATRPTPKNPASAAEAAPAAAEPRAAEEAPRRAAPSTATAAPAPPPPIAAILAGPPPFDPTPIASEAHPELQRPADAPRVREVPQAAAYRESAVSSPSAEARVEAISKLAYMGGPSDLPALNHLIATDPDLRVRDAAHHAALVIHSRFAGQDWK